MSSIQVNFQYHLSKWMLEHIFYWINFKVQANCFACLEGESFDSYHYCEELQPKYHTREHLLEFYTEAYNTVSDMVRNTASIMEDVQRHLTVAMLHDGFTKEEIRSINTEDNIILYGVNSQSSLYSYMFHQLWMAHPEPILNLTQPQQMVEHSDAIPDQQTTNNLSTETQMVEHSPDDIPDQQTTNNLSGAIASAIVAVYSLKDHPDQEVAINEGCEGCPDDQIQDTQ